MPFTPQSKLILINGSNERVAFSVSGTTLSTSGTNLDGSVDDLGIGGMVSHIKFNEGVGTAADDTVATVNTGTITGGAHWTTGQFSNALDFQGDDDAFFPDINRYSPHAGNATTGAMAVSMWLKSTGNPTSGSYFLSKTSSSGTGNEYRIVQSGTNLIFELYNDAPGVGITISYAYSGAGNLVPNDSAFHNVIISLDKANGTERIAIYSDGVKKAANATAFSGTQSLDLGLGLNFGGLSGSGAPNNSDHLNITTFDQFRMFDKKLTDGGVAVGNMATVGSDVYLLATEV